MELFSIIIPIYNEEQILRNSIERLIKELRQKKAGQYEIILAENGSTDKTRFIAGLLARKYAQVTTFHLPFPDFGNAFREGVKQARAKIIILFNADWWDIDFLQKSISLLIKYSIVVGSKTLESKLDKRPWLRRVGSLSLTAVLQALFHYSGTDSHGIKAFRKKELMTILNESNTHEVIESEVLVRAQLKGIKIKELPVGIKEIRSARLSFYKRCVMVASELIYLRKKLRQEGLL